MNILFWDIDGTLIRTSRAGLFAFEEATTDLWVKSIDFEGIECAGMTDHSIATQIIEKLTGRKAMPDEIIGLTSRYENLLPGHLGRREAWLLPSVKEILEGLAGQQNFRHLLLTGNSRIGSEIKLKHLGIADYFDFSRSAFCDEQYFRSEIAQYAKSIVELWFSDDGPPRIFVIGDTPNDILCGQSIGAYTVAVATGNFSVSQLEAFDPWWTLEKLPSVAEFQDKIENA